MRNLSGWGPASKDLLREAERDLVILPERHVLPTERAEVLREWSKFGYQPVLAPSNATQKSKKAVGISMRVRKRYPCQTFRHLATKAEFQMGLRGIGKSNNDDRGGFRRLDRCTAQSGWSGSDSNLPLSDRWHWHQRIERHETYPAWHSFAVFGEHIGW